MSRDLTLRATYAWINSRRGIQRRGGSEMIMVLRGMGWVAKTPRPWRLLGLIS